MKCDEVGRLLDASIDGELDLSKQLEFEAHLECCPSCRALVDERSGIRDLVRANLTRYPAPPRLAAKIRADLREEREPGNNWLFSFFAHRQLIAASLIMAVALSVGWYLWPKQGDGLVAEAIADHSRSLLVDHLIDIASTDQHTVKPWFNGKTDYSPPVVDLTPSGFALIGGRMDVLDRRAVAAIVYQRRKHFINLFVWPTSGKALGGGVVFQNGYHVARWTKSGLDYLAVSELAESEFREFVGLIQQHTE